MRITSIQPQVKREGRYSIYIDGEYFCSLSAESLLDSKLSTGQTITEREQRSLKQLSVDDKAYSLALAYIARRLRSEGELIDYFKRKGYDATLSANILERLKKIQMVDDADFARRWVESRRSLKSTSTNRLRQELRQKKVRSDHIETALWSDDSTDQQMLRGLIEKKRRQSRYQADDKLIAYLARQGFLYEDIKAVLLSSDEVS